MKTPDPMNPHIVIDVGNPNLTEDEAANSATGIQLKQWVEEAFQDHPIAWLSGIMFDDMKCIYYQVERTNDTNSPGYRLSELGYGINKEAEIVTHLYPALIRSLTRRFGKEKVEAGWTVSLVSVDKIPQKYRP